MDKANCGLDYKSGITIYKFGKDVKVAQHDSAEYKLGNMHEIS